MNDFNFYFGLGWSHILTVAALDHLLFLAALAAVFTLRDWRRTLILATSFTIGHTFALVAATKGWVTVNEALIEFLVPCTIIITAITNLFQRSYTAQSARINYALALFFGLIHGLAFAEVLTMILAREQSFTASVASFAAGLEVAQLLVVILLLLVCQLFIGTFRIDRRHWVIFISAAVFALSLEMAAQRWPWRDMRERDAVTTPDVRQLNQGFPQLF